MMLRFTCKYVLRLFHLRSFSLYRISVKVLHIWHEAQSLRCNNTCHHTRRMCVCVLQFHVHALCANERRQSITSFPVSPCFHLSLSLALPFFHFQSNVRSAKPKEYSCTVCIFFCFCSACIAAAVVVAWFHHFHCLVNGTRWRLRVPFTGV